MSISKKLLQDTIDFWERECPKIMDSQKEYNKKALELSKANLEKMINEYDN